MQPDVVLKAEADAESPESNINVSSAKDSKSGRPQSKAGAGQNGGANGQFPPPKTDKPRPHICNTCGRSFARLEHLKRHERSHTKEKPFECAECTRCFARRDLLLRHQQKLHLTGTPSSKPRSGRRESVSSAGVASGRVRKNSMANGASGPNGTGIGHRPRANTISHIDLSGLGMMDTPSFSRLNALGLGHVNMGGLPGPMNMDYRGMSTAMGSHGNMGLPKLDTHALNNMDMTNSLRTAPPQPSFGGFDIDQLFNPGTTVNPAQLHFGGSSSTNQFNMPPLEPFTVHPAIDPQAQNDDFGWMKNWHMQVSQDGNENAIDESSPSRMSSGDSPGDWTESMSNSTAAMPIQNNFQWEQHEMQRRQSMGTGPFHLDSLGTGLPNLEMQPNTISPSTLHDPTPTADAYFQQAMMQQQQQQQQLSQQFQQQQQNLQQPEMIQGQQQNFFPTPLSQFNSDSPSMSSSSITGSNRQSSVTSVSTDSITDATRQALLLTLSQPSVFGHNPRKYSQPNISSPLSPSGGARGSIPGPSLPSTKEIRRFVEAFIQYAHPHIPVTHVPTLSFESIEASIKGGSPSSSLGGGGVGGGAGCLVLGMAAIGALYEYEHPASKELFNAAKKMITLYLEERRKADVTAAVSGSNAGSDGHPHTPLWLVQAMFLNVIYGHQCGDKTAADIASNHCAALVSLARAADLAQPQSTGTPSSDDAQNGTNDVEMSESSIAPGDSVSRHQSAETDLHTQWITWKNAEERKRTLFAIFIVSSLLTTAYNATPTIMNSEILLDLPCDEELYSAGSAQEWQDRGGLVAAEQNTMSFATALSTLLTANQRQGRNYTSTAYNSNNPLGALQAGDGLTDNDFRPSTFGCLVLINALHNYIWETRSRHHGRQWTPQETESMFSHIEPALSAWLEAWKSNEHHKLERPNPFGMGPLSADSIPLLDLAFVRLFVNLGRSKEAFWHRDFDQMADELAHGSEIVQHAEGTPSAPSEQERSNRDGNSPANNAVQRRPSQDPNPEQAISRRERHLRKAAYYAADSLTMACTYSLTYCDAASHELPVQSAMCFFDCAQVLAEWACTVQERVGCYLGVLGRDPVDYTQVPAIMMLQAEDVELFRKIERICESFEAKRFQHENLLAMETQSLSAMSNVNLGLCGYGSKILRITAMMLEKAVVWPVTHVMAKALDTQAAHMDRRAEESTMSN
ncbi:uncharacterized protein LTR77_007303 [Saxophila tyrrhenica]|uniref:C2H2-type domain-containing protein n=1 Tax=Saxophila tyrrhenica TaxID=1690608 RepID=A0AAV9P7N3_9PEZI|nr:hypothetical protein LTR77_007303 [Saxophila tyrrhenica]